MPNNSYFLYSCTSFISPIAYMCASHKKVKECSAFFLSSFPQMWTSSSFWVIWYITRNHGLLTKKISQKDPCGLFAPLVQFDKNVILNKLIVTCSFWLSVFGWLFWQVFLLSFFNIYFLLVKWDNHISAPIWKFWNFQLKENPNNIYLFIYNLPILLYLGY